jgi:hypothetical protein
MLLTQLKKADAVSARHHVSQLAKHHAVLQTKNARIRIINNFIL